MTESEIFQLLKKLEFTAKSHVLMPHVRDATGFAGTRTADAVAFGLWPSRGMEVEGIEIKVSRSDWLRELKEPQKAQEIFQYCDRWWLVVPDKDIVKQDELPSTWGMMVVKDNKIAKKVLAPKLNPKPLDKGIICSFLRQIPKEFTPNIEIEAKMAEAVKVAEIKGQMSVEVDGYKVARLQKSIEEFERNSGVKIDQYNGAKLGKAVELVTRYGVDRFARELTWVVDHMKRTLDSAKNDLQEFKKEFPQVVPEGSEA